MVKRLAVLGILLVLGFGAGVSWFYVKNKPCRIELVNYSQDFSLEISDKKKWRYFAEQIGNCENNRFTVYGIDGEGQGVKASSVLMEINNLPHKHSLRNQEGKIFYSWDISFDRKKNQARLEFNIPAENTEKMGKRVADVLVYTGYYVFSGKSYADPEPRVSRFNSLEALGLRYEKK
jgi:hypothetical protein